MYNIKMIKWLKRHLVPHKNNNYRPEFLYGHDYFFIFIAVIAIEVAFLFSPVIIKNQSADVITGFLTVLTNEERERNNLPDLVINPVLNQAAELKARDMADKGYFAHTSPEGKTPWYWLDLVGYKYDYAGENLAVNFTDTKDVTKAWMDSPAHRANIMKQPYREIGSGVATGTYNGQASIFAVQVYGNPVVIEKVKPVAKTNKISTNSREVATLGKTEVLGASVEKMKVLGESTTTNTQAIKILSEENTPKKISFLSRVLLTAREWSNQILLCILVLIIFIFILNLFVKIKIQHRDLILNGIFIILVIILFYLINIFLINNTQIDSSAIDYSQASTTK